RSFGCRLCCGSLLTGARLRRLALGALLFFACALLLCQVGLLATQQLGLTPRLLLAPLQLGVVDHRLGRLRLRRGRVVALDEGALLADLDLDRARATAGIGLLDLARRAPGQGDLLALAAVRAAQ